MRRVFRRPDIYIGVTSQGLLCLLGSVGLLVSACDKNNTAKESDEDVAPQATASPIHNKINEAQAAGVSESDEKKTQQGEESQKLLTANKISLKLIAPESGEPQGLVRIRLGNGFDQAIKSARIWVFLSDKDGRVIGKKAQWVIGEAGSVKTLPSLETKEFKMLLKTTTPYHKAKATFSSLTLKDGTKPHPESVMISFQKDM